VTRGEVSAWMVAPMVAGILVLLLGVHPPAGLSDLLTQAAAQLQATP
jgi:hydrogenase-4 component F